MSEAGPSLRLFVAVELPETWHEALAQMQRRLAQLLETPATPRLRWVRQEGIHLTLKFLGNVALDLVPDIEQALGRAVTEAPGITLTIGGPGYFRTRDRSISRDYMVRVVFAAVRGETERLADLARRIDLACAELGFGRERRPFEPHLTLARTADNAQIVLSKKLGEAFRTFEMPAAPEFTVQRVSLMRSHLERGGARYERIASWPRAPEV